MMNLAFGLGTPEILIIAVVVMVLFGATAIPKFAKNIGKAKSEFEKGVKEVQKEADKEQKEKDKENKKESSDKTDS